MLRKRRNCSDKKCLNKKCDCSVETSAAAMLEKDRKVVWKNCQKCDFICEKSFQLKSHNFYKHMDTKVSKKLFAATVKTIAKSAASNYE